MAPQLEALSSRGNSTMSSSNEPIAIIGSGCRFPGESCTPSKLWNLLREPRDVLSEIPESRFDPNGFYHPDNMHHGTSNVRHSYVLSEEHRHFDAQFFGIKPSEANSIDPQQRILLEVVYESVESAGLSLDQLQGSQTAVYVGLMSVDYADMLNRDLDYFPTYFATGTARSIISNRISYFFDWHGPSMTIDTACSSSLTAVHQAVQALRAGDSRIAIAAGANLILGPEQYVADSKLKMLSPSGRSQMWDKNANGYARGEGIAAVVLKTLSAALADGDHIECLIRETGINQDGRTKGITMPSATAQAALISSTYAKAGLDLSRKCDRPHYFEAHGTGTPAGDPIEAEAISTAFFGAQSKFEHGSKDRDVLYVGSIKTVIGHTESTAGLAAVLKASLALQDGVIPPNRLLNSLNPAIKPFYKNLEVPSLVRPWPTIEEGTPRRASVNSFGFGGSNVHAILESYGSPKAQTGTASSNSLVFTPFNFSAASESSLTSQIAAYSTYLKANKTVSLRDLSWTLNTRRSTFPVRASFSALTVDSLYSKLDASLQAITGKTVSMATRSFSSSTKPRLLGVFTGQGAQWARMGAELIVGSKSVQRSIANLEQSLAELPFADRPSWSLTKEILADSNSSRINEAALSQPLCTAIQIILVDLLHSAGVKFEAVVGHSSGEIGAAYAAGYLSSHDAIRIAYYRGFHLKLAHGSEGKKGSMMAVGTSFEDATELCELPSFEGRICVAATNSSASVTISGDSDAIEEAKLVFEEEKKFSRLLKVDKAYHSYHMLSCSEAYIRSLQACEIQIKDHSNSSCSWISSVYGEDIVNVQDSLKDTYWNNNMVNPVLFSPAVGLTVAERGPFDTAIEIGPHPVLKGPATQTIQDIAEESIPYTGVLSRGKNDIEAFADGLGCLWLSLGETAVDFAGYDELVSSGLKPSLLKDLPPYSWDHERIFWHESRVSKAFRTKHEPIHELLGSISPDGTKQQIRWHNFLLPREVPWLQGHRVQGQMVFPAAGYISAALEAIRIVAGKEPMRLIELQDFIIGQALVFNDEDSGVETLFTVTDIMREDQATLTARFSFFSATGKDSSIMTLNVSGRLLVTFGHPSIDALPPKPEDEFNLIEVESDRFYSSLGELGFEYTGPFRALALLRRKMGMATGVVASPASSHSETPLMIHPATLDAAIQSIILAYSFPGDSRLWSIHLPTSIERIRVNPSLCIAHAGQGYALPFNSTVTADGSTEVEGDVDIYAGDGRYTMLQLEGMHTKPLSNATPRNDLPIFSEMTWDTDAPQGKTTALDWEAAEYDNDLASTIERVAYFYLRNLDGILTREEREKAEQNHKALFAYVDHVLSHVESGTHPYGKKEWILDTHDEILSQIRKYPESIDLKLIQAVGRNLPAVVRNQLIMLEPMMENNMLNEFYVDGLGMPEYIKHLARMVSQIGHRFPNMKVLEIGAGTGGATKEILKQLCPSFASYTFTDISRGFFEKAQETFQAYESKMTFKALDIEKDLAEQGYANNSYDVIVASLVLHATSKLEDTMRNVRRLLKPGGYLLILEITDNDQMRFGLIFGGLPGWWLGYEDGRILSPCISIGEWNTIIQRTGFAGIDAIFPNHESLPIPFSVIAAQAVDNRVNFLRQPLSSSLDLRISRLTIVGGSTPKTSRLVDDIRGMLAPHCDKATHVNSLADLNFGDVPFMGTILSLTDLDEPTFKSITAGRLQGLQQLFKQSKNVLWITQGCRGSDPYSNMIVGFGRTLVLEMPHIRLQLLDIETSEEPNARVLAEKLLQFEIADLWEQQGLQDELLWTFEPEIFLEKGKHLIPRLRFSKARNNRYNSSRRFITKEMDPKVSTLGVQYVGTSYVVQEFDSLPLPGTITSDRIVVQVSHSILHSFKITSADFLFLVLGTNIKTGEQVITLSDTQKSVIEVPHKWSIPCPASLEQSLQHMTMIHTHLMAQAIVGDLSAGETLVIFQPSELIATTLAHRATEKGIHLVYLTTRSNVKDPLWISIHPSAPLRAIKAKLPGNVSCFLNMSGDQIVASHIVECLSPQCKVWSQDSLTGKESRVDLFSMNLILGLLRTAWSRSQNEPFSVDLQKIPIIPLSEISPDTPIDKSMRLINWVASATVPVKIEPVDSKPMFAKDKTYWLVGLTGGLGFSLCSWMVSHGARYVVMSSRNPKVDKRWLKGVEALGAAIKISSSDITDRNSVHALYKEICNTLPPIAGVAQGAMVLHDTMFLDLDMTKLEKVLKPKVEGSIYLDELFTKDTLDFFVFFSSMACVMGNPGQSAYGAANMFMSGLAAQRRKRGLAASVINVGAIVGNGYVTRELSLAQQMSLRKAGTVWMSEQDLHQTFAEAVLTGRSDSKNNMEIMTGLRLVYTNEEEKTNRFYNPKFQHCVLQQEDVDVASSNTKSGIRIKAQLLEATTQEDIKQIIEESFISKLQTVLQADQERSMVGLSADELGIDSLVAVDLRSWFLKELSVDMPVLKILGGATISDLLAHAEEHLPKELVPHLVAENGSKTMSKKSEKPKAEPQEKRKVQPQSNGRRSAAARLRPSKNSINQFSQEPAPNLSAGINSEAEFTTFKKSEVLLLPQPKEDGFHFSLGLSTKSLELPLRDLASDESANSECTTPDSRSTSGGSEES